MHGGPLIHSEIVFVRKEVLLSHRKVIIIHHHCIYRITSLLSVALYRLTYASSVVVWVASDCVFWRRGTLTTSSYTLGLFNCFWIDLDTCKVVWLYRKYGGNRRWLFPDLATSIGELDTRCVVRWWLHAARGHVIHVFITKIFLHLIYRRARWLEKTIS